ncbi:hypothetical protein [Dokdonella soli]
MINACIGSIRHRVWTETGMRRTDVRTGAKPACANQRTSAGIGHRIE